MQLVQKSHPDTDACYDNQTAWCMFKVEYNQLRERFQDPPGSWVLSDEVSVLSDPTWSLRFLTHHTQAFATFLKNRLRHN